MDCPTHGDFTIPATVHLRGVGCPKCKDRRKFIYNSKNSFVEAATKLHNNKYDYTNTELHPDDSRLKIVIRCPQHGEFRQTIYSHMNGGGCPQCARLKCNPVKTTERFIAEANMVYKHKYDYSKTNYIHSLKKVIIICPDHGEFLQSPQYHLQGHGCLKCKREKSKHIRVVEVISSSKLNNTSERIGIYNPFSRKRI